MQSAERTVVLSATDSTYDLKTLNLYPDQLHTLRYSHPGQSSQLLYIQAMADRRSRQDDSTQ